MVGIDPGLWIQFKMSTFNALFKILTIVVWLVFYSIMMNH